MVSRNSGVDDWVPGQRMTRAVARVMGSVRQVSDATEYGYDGGISILGAFLGKGKTVSMVRPLEAGETYAFLGGGDNNVSDMDVHLLGPGGAEVAQDTDDDATPAVVYRAARSGNYTVKVKLYEAEGSGFCALAILRKGGWDVPVSNLTRATAVCIAAGTILDDKARGGALFRTEDNQWALYGGVLEKDEEDDAVPVVLHETRPANRSGVRIKNARLSGPALILMAALDIETSP